MPRDRAISDMIDNEVDQQAAAADAARLASKDAKVLSKRHADSPIGFNPEVETVRQLNRIANRLDDIFFLMKANTEK